jgi:hypothetical protein
MSHQVVFTYGKYRVTKNLSVRTVVWTRVNDYGIDATWIFDVNKIADDRLLGDAQK